MLPGFLIFQIKAEKTANTDAFGSEITDYIDLATSDLALKKGAGIHAMLLGTVIALNILFLFTLYLL